MFSSRRRRGAAVLCDRKNAASWRRFLRYFCSHFWLATPQEVLQADWQEVWHSPQPPFLTLSQRLRVFRVLILFMMIGSHLIEFLSCSALRGGETDHDCRKFSIKPSGSQEGGRKLPFAFGVAAALFSNFLVK